MSELREVLKGITRKLNERECNDCRHILTPECHQVYEDDTICPKQIDQIIAAIKPLCWLKDERFNSIEFPKEFGWRPVKEIEEGL